MGTVEQVFTATELRDPFSQPVSKEVIRHRAYEIFVRRGMQDGRAEEDWFEAETELRNETRHEQQQQSWTDPSGV
jgi:hypothetical protein